MRLQSRQYYSDLMLICFAKTPPVYLILFPSNTVQKKGTDSIFVGFFSMFRAATLPEVTEI